jgi:hypothetical protein
MKPFESALIAVASRIGQSRCRHQPPLGELDELDATWRAMLRDSERKFIYGTTLVSRVRAEHVLYISFLVRRAMQGVAVPDEPHFDEIATPYFRSLIGDCRFYLEYGSGGSTVLAAALNKPFVSVDTDRLFLESVRGKIGALTSAQRLLHADIGLIGPWGIPFPAGKPSPRRLNKWKAYAQTPWPFISQDNTPDLILIDGRFRVATALTCCMHLSARSEVKILIDDYVDRPSYHVIERHAKLVRVLGRMAVFHPSRGDQSALHEVINQYSADWL